MQSISAFFLSWVGILLAYLVAFWYNNSNKGGDCLDLDIIRQEIDQIDDQIVKLLEERMHLVEGVVAYKKASGKPILDTKREAIIFEKVRSRVEDKRYRETIVATFSDILKRSRDYQDQNIKWKKNNFIR